MADQLARTRQLVATTAEWAAVNPFVVANGEIAIEIKADGSRWFKIGDGVTTFANLEYAFDFSLSPTYTNLLVTGVLTATSIEADLNGSVYAKIKNTESESLPKGTPFYITGTATEAGFVEVKKAIASDVSSGPANGLTIEAISAGGQGKGALSGVITGYNTSAAGWLSGQALYVGQSGELATSPPAGYKQIIGRVGRIGVTNGSIFVENREITGTTAGTVAAGNDPRFSSLTNSVNTLTSDVANILVRLGNLQFDNSIYVAKNGNDLTNTGTKDSPLATIRAAASIAQPGDVVFVSPGIYEEIFPIRWKRDVTVFGSGLRSVTIQPATGYELEDIFKVDSGFWCWGLSFAGHQADETEQSWAISFDEQADNSSLGAIGLGAYIRKSPYIQNCTSITAEDDSGLAGSTSTGNTGGGIKVDGTACAVNSPIRSMVVDSYTQVNLGGPGCLVLNDGYAQLVSFFGTFCTYHVRCETGGQVNLSGGGTTDFGTYGLMADGFSPSPLYTGSARTEAYGAERIEKTVLIDVATNVFTATSHGLQLNDQIILSATLGSLPSNLSSSQTYYVISSGLTANQFKVSTSQGGSEVDVAGAADGTYKFVRQGANEIDVIGTTANRLGTASRPNPGQLMFPQLTFPRNATTGLAETKTFAYTRISSFVLTFQEAASPSGPEHIYVSGGTAVINGVDYGIEEAIYNKNTGLVTLTTATQLPSGNGNVTVGGLAFICPTSAYIVTGSIPIDAGGNVVDNSSPSRAGYRVLFFSGLNGGLRNKIAVGQKLDFRNRSQISAPGHTFEFVGSGTNYSALPWNGGVPVQANAIVETNNGRVYSSSTNEKGDFAVGSQFAVDGTTGAVTINTDQFNLSGLNFIGPFSRNGGISTVGEQLREVSNNTSLISSTGAPDANTVPTQFAVKEFTGSRYVTNVTATAGQPITLTGSAQADGNGNWTFARNIQLSLNTANGLARLDGSGKLPSSIVPTTDSVSEGTTNLYFTQSRSRAAISATGLIAYNSLTGVITYAGDTPITTIPPTDLSYDASTRLLASSTGADTTLPLFSSVNAGLAPGSGGGSLNFLRADGTWAAPPTSAGTDLSYTAATRTLASSTGADVVLPLFGSTTAGLTPNSGGGTVNFLRADGVWAAPTAPSSGVTSFSGGSTGLTPNTAQTGAVTLGGTLGVANGGTGVTSGTGSGSVVLNNSPTLVTPYLGTPYSGNLLNCTGYSFVNLTSRPTTIAGYGITDGVSLNGANSFTGQNVFLNSYGQLFKQGANTDGIVVRGGSSGTTSLIVALTTATLTASRTIAFPNVNGTLITSGDTATVTNQMLAGSISNDKLAQITTAGAVSGTAITSGNISTTGSISTTGAVAVGQSSAASNVDFDLAGTYAQTAVSVGAFNIDCSLGNYFTKSVSSSMTFTVSNVPASRVYAFTFEVIYSSGIITWFSGIFWPSGAAPSLAAGRVHLLTFLTRDGGTTWRGTHYTNYQS